MNKTKKWREPIDLNEEVYWQWDSTIRRDALRLLQKIYRYWLWKLTGKPAKSPVKGDVCDYSYRVTFFNPNTGKETDAEGNEVIK